MPLRKKRIPVNLGFGIDTKTDDKQSLDGRLLYLQNAVFKKTKRLSKRYGFDELSDNIIDSGDIETGFALNNWNDELNLWDGNNFNTYIESQDAWLNKGTAVSCIIESKSIIRNDNTYSNVTAAYNNNLVCFTYEEGGELKYTIKDVETDSTVIFDDLVDANGVRSTVVSFFNNFIIFYSDGSDLYYRKIATVNPTQIESPVQILSDYDAANGVYDVSVVGDYIWIAYNDDSSGISLRRINNLLSISLDDPVDANAAVNTISVVGDENQNVWISWFDGTDVKGSVWAYTKTETLASTTIEANTSANVLNITAAVDGTTGQFVYELDATNTYDHLLRTNTLTIAGTAGTAEDLKRSVGLVSKAFTFNDKSYVVALYQSDLQATYFIIDFDGTIVGKIAYTTAGTLISDTVLTEVPVYTDGNFIFPSQIKIALQTEDSEVYTNLGLQYSFIDFSSDNRFQNETLDNLHIVGGILQSYDGISLTEHNFHLYPENISSNIANSGGNIENGTRSYKFCYEWTDNLGQIHRSTPSIAISVTNTGSNVSTNTFTVPTLRLTNKISDKSPVRIVGYRTEAAGTLYYRFTSISSPSLNNVETDTVVVTDTSADTTIIGNDTLYTSTVPPVVENSPPPNCSMITTFKNQLVIGGFENKLQLWISKEKKPGFGVEFSDLMTIDVDSLGGDITAIKGMDDKLVIFKRRSIFVLFGDGYNNTLTQNSLQKPQLITTDVGCTNINSVVLTPQGLMFRSEKGIYLLTRGLETQYIGARVEAYNEYEITSSTLVADQNHIRFTTNNDYCLVYDYFYNEWSVFTNSSAEDGIVWNNRFVYLKTNGKCYLENYDRFDDYGSFVPMKIVTQWFSFTNLQNLQRIYRMLILGEYISRHKLKVQVRYDFNPIFTQEKLIDIYNIESENGYPFQTTTYGSVSPYGAEIVYGGEYPVYQFQINFKRQKCESISISIEDVQDGSTLGESFNITNMNMIVGIKGQDNKFKSSKVFSTS